MKPEETAEETAEDPHREFDRFGHEIPILEDYDHGFEID